MGKKGGTNFASVVGWTGCLLMFSAFLIWVFDDGAYPWLQNPSPNTRAMQSAVRSGLFSNVSVTQQRQFDEGVSWGKSERKVTGPEYIAENVTGTLSHQDVNGSIPGTGNMSANHVPRGGRGVNISTAERHIAENVTGTLSRQDVNGSNPVAGNMSANHVPRVGRGINISMAEPLAGLRSNISMAEPSAGLQRQCDLFKGRWVYDKSYVLYPPGSCPYASIDFNCRKNGRMDSDYERWRWKPQDCDLPRFNASLMLERLRNRRLVYVGDSISRNQWESMLCLMRAVVPDHETTHKSDDNSKFIQYFFKAYNCSIELSWAPFLVRRHPVRAINGSTIKETLQLDRIDEQAKRWKHADILVFNTGHWWTHEEPYNGVDYFEEKGHVIPHMEELVAFGKALRTWARWIDTNIDPKHTQVFFRGYSPVHFHGQAWGKRVGGGCFKETEPIHVKIEKEIERIYGERQRMQVVEKVVAETQSERKNVRVKLLNVTQLSMHRKDAHASVYTSKIKYMKNENDYSIVDCSHWCLPGLPDVWNNILYALII